MEQIAPRLWLLSGWPRYRVNCYLAGDVLIDCATRWHSAFLRRQLAGRPLSQVALTHGHPDHQGAAHSLCSERSIPLACHELDADAVEGREPMHPRHFPGRLLLPLIKGPTHPVSRRLKEGDRVGEFTVIHAPGHTPGHCFFFREADGVIIAGDVMANINFLTGREGLREPPHLLSTDLSPLWIVGRSGRKRS